MHLHKTIYSLHFNAYFKSETKELFNALEVKPTLNAFKAQSSFLDLNYTIPLKSRMQCASHMQIKRFHLDDNNAASNYLTHKELNVAHQLILGLSAREIAERNFVSKRTVETHIGNIKNKLGVVARSDLMGKLIEIGVNDICIN